MTISPEATSDTHDEDDLLDLISKHVELHDRDFAARPEWAYQSSAHLLLALGRRFTIAPRPHDLVGMPDRLCHGNSARYATEHQAEGSVYVEGLALINVGGQTSTSPTHGSSAPMAPSWTRPGTTVLAEPT